MIKEGKKEKKKELRAVNSGHGQVCWHLDLNLNLNTHTPTHPMSQAMVHEDAARMEREAGLTGKEVGGTARNG